MVEIGHATPPTVTELPDAEFQNEAPEIVKDVPVVGALGGEKVEILGASNDTVCDAITERPSATTY